MPTLNRKQCIGDDLANCCGHCDKRIAAVIPVLGRLPLLKYTIKRLLEKNGVTHVICVGESQEEKKVCEDAGASFIRYKNTPLGRKWNAGFIEAKSVHPDACLFVGSSDWLSDNWIDCLYPSLKTHDMVGMPGCYFLDIGDTYRLVRWPGYTGRREGESIGIGRLISSSLLDDLQWKPFESYINNSLDYSMYSKVNESKRALVTVSNVMSLSISTNQWVNKHRFSDHWNGSLKSERIAAPEKWLERYFPEALKVF